MSDEAVARQEQAWASLTPTQLKQQKALQSQQDALHGTTFPLAAPPTRRARSLTAAQGATPDTQVSCSLGNDYEVEYFYPSSGVYVDCFSAGTTYINYGAGLDHGFALNPNYASGHVLYTGSNLPYSKYTYWSVWRGPGYSQWYYFASNLGDVTIFETEVVD